MTRYEVHLGYHGRPIVRRGPAEGLPDFPRQKWVKITPRPLGLARATALADAQEQQAVVTAWESSEVAYRNGKAPAVPEGWLPSEEWRP